MRVVRILVEHFEFISYLELKGTKKINEHGSLSITGLIHPENEQEYFRLAEKESWVKVSGIAENGEERILFHGVLTEMHIKKENKLSILTIELKTGSFLLDIEPHIRSFQDSNSRYTDIISTCMKETQGKAIMLAKKDMITDRFLLQYHETDWEFFKRLASYMGVAVIPEDAVSGKKLYFGYHEEKMWEGLPSDSFCFKQDYGRYKKRTALGIKGIVQEDAASCIVQTRDVYGLGENIKFEGKDFIIGEIRSWLEGQELYHEYRLVTKTGGLLDPIYNNRISGISLNAEITGVEKTEVQIRLLDDENRQNCGKKWFDYATVYSTPDGTGWYCMPEIGDQVRMVIPDNVEEHAYVASSIHLDAAGGRGNPSEKFWKNRQNKEILFTPVSIVLKNNQGLQVELSDDEGIKIASDKDIIVESQKDIQIISRSAGINMNAANMLSMQQGAAQIRIDNAISIGGGKIYMN